MNDRLLPVGSVVLLKDAEKRLMIVGYYPTVVEEAKETTYDYRACLFPEGIMDSKNALLLNHKDIDKIFYYGLMDEEQNYFMNQLEDLVNKENLSSNAPKADGIPTPNDAGAMSPVEAMPSTNDVGIMPSVEAMPTPNDAGVMSPVEAMPSTNVGQSVASQLDLLASQNIG